MSLNPSAPMVRDVDPRVLPASLHHWRASRARLSTVVGLPGTFVRASSVSGVADGTPGGGVTYTAPHSFPAWSPRDWDNDGAAEALGLLMGTADRLSWAGAPPPQAMMLRLEIVETGAVIGSAGGTLWSLRNDGATGAGLWLDTSGTASGRYRFNYSDGSTTRSALLSSGRPTAGQRVVFEAELSAAGAIAFRQSIEGAAPNTATAAALALPASWASGARIRLNSRGASSNPGSAWYRVSKLLPASVDWSLAAGVL